ncbi:hypothetical protein SAMN04487995_5650 [Dyadobacter koreensis]|uniref:Type IX secretion system membrane protein, PorP/SprF family n=1 Tax=Dyadobacter koreensis TaxID=408657 RepID=A0A1H7ADU5_9BACT|nr:hypothetical protein [Dyadobacter koreensis]SEJ63813.1 hypothetical protein SAMN04487995_5650 [Dyadobacter koreensis]
MKEQSGHLSRQKNFLRSFVIFLILSTKSFADGSPFPVGARSWGLANATIARSDYYSIGNNVAGLGGIKTAAIFSTYNSHFNFEGISTLGVGAVMPLSEDLGIGLSIRRFGDNVYNQIAVGAGAGHHIGRFSLGLKLNYLQTAISSSAIIFSKKALVLEFGGIVMISSKLYFGAHMYNVTQSSYSDNLRERVDTSLRTGFLYKPSKTVELSAEIEKVTDNPMTLRIGLEYEIVRNFFVRTGINSKPQTNHFGIGFKVSQFHLNYAMHTHPQLGWSHHFSICYVFFGNKNTAIKN